MSEPDSAPPAQKPSEPAASPVPPPLANPPPERPKWLHDRLRLLAEPHKIQGGTGLALLALYLYVQWQGLLGPIVSAAEAVGGPLAADVMRFFASPLAAIPLAFWLGFSLWAASAWRNREDRRLVAVVTWAMLAVFFVPLSSVALFGYFVAESKIPAAVSYYEWQQAERRLSQGQRDALYAALRKVADRLPKFQVAAQRDPEATQYAGDFMGVFFAAGLRLDNGTRQDARVEPLDLASPSYYRGVMVGVQDRHSPPQGALILRDALKEAGAEVRFVDAATGPGDRFMFLVGPK